MRSILKTTLNWGAGNTLVKVYSANERQDTVFHQHHGPTCLGSIRQNRYCEGCGKNVEYADIVKGTAVGDALVVVTNEDIKALDEEQGGIELLDFVDADAVDTALYSGATYFLDADVGGGKGKRENLGPARSYAMLREALAKSGKVGIVKFALRQRSNMGVLRVVHRPSGPPALAIHTLLWDAEIRDTSALTGAAKDIELTAKEVAMALALVEAYTGEWVPTAHADTYRERVADLVATKAAGGEFQTVAAASDEGGGSGVDDMLAKLQATIEAKKAEKEAALEKSVAAHPAGKKARAPRVKKTTAA